MEKKNKNKHECKIKWESIISVALGGAISLVGTICSMHFQLEEVKQTHIYSIEKHYIEEKEALYVEVISSIYSLQQMYDGLIEADVLSFRKESYDLLAKVRIFASEDITRLYEQFLQEIFSEEHIYNGDLVDNELIPAIREDIGLTN